MTCAEKNANHEPRFMLQYRQGTCLVAPPVLSLPPQFRLSDCIRGCLPSSDATREEDETFKKRTRRDTGPSLVLSPTEEVKTISAASCSYGSSASSWSPLVTALTVRGELREAEAISHLVQHQLRTRRVHAILSRATVASRASSCTSAAVSAASDSSSVSPGLSAGSAYCMTATFVRTTAPTRRMLRTIGSSGDWALMKKRFPFRGFRAIWVE